MSTAPLPKDGEYLQVLVLDQWQDEGYVGRGWKLVYWLDAFDGKPAGWYGNHSGDLRNPLGWILSTAELPTVESTTFERSEQELREEFVNLALRAVAPKDSTSN